MLSQNVCHFRANLKVMDQIHIHIHIHIHVHNHISIYTHTHIRAITIF